MPTSETANHARRADFTMQNYEFLQENFFNRLSFNINYYAAMRAHVCSFERYKTVFP